VQGRLNSEARPGASHRVAMRRHFAVAEFSSTGGEAGYGAYGRFTRPCALLQFRFFSD
jgi:hypothetical protein